MIKIFLTLLLTIFSHLNTDSSKVEPARLDKKNEKISFDLICRKICPYVLFFALALLTVLVIVILVKYGFMFSTEANNWYYHME